MTHIQIQIFRPINAQEINGWLRENPQIQIKGLSVAAGADTPDEGIPLSICAILFESSASPADVGRAALAEADQLIDQVSGEDAARHTPPQAISVQDPSVDPRHPA